MIVFILTVIIIILSIVILLLLSAFIKIKIENFKIENYDNLKEIFLCILEKRYTDILEYVSFKNKIQISLFNKVPIISIEMSNLNLKQKIQKAEKKTNYNKKIQKQKKEFKDIFPITHLDKLNLKMNVGTIDASITALLVSVINIIISFVIPTFITDGKTDDYNYEVSPVYVDKGFFNTLLSMQMSIHVLTAIKTIKSDKVMEI